MVPARTQLESKKQILNTDKVILKYIQYIAIKSC